MKKILSSYVGSSIQYSGPEGKGSLFPMQGDRTVRDTSVSVRQTMWDPEIRPWGTLDAPSNSKKCE